MLGLAIVAFANSLPGQFFYDDEEAIVRNPYVRSLWPLSSAVQSPPQSAVAGRPLVSLSLAANYAIGELDPSGYHAFNLLVHVSAALLLFGTLRRALRGRRVPAQVAGSADGLALACALIWLVHPLQTEVVDYTIQRTESMMGACYLLTLYAGIRGMQAAGSGRGWLALSVVACVLGAACKESIVTAPLMVWLYDVVFESGPMRESWRRRAPYYAGLLASWGVLAALNASGPRSSSAGFGTGVSPAVYLLQQAPMIVTYLARAVWPHPLVADYGRAVADVSFAAAAPYLAVVLALAAVTIAGWRRDPRWAYLGTWFFVTLAPSSSIVPIATEAGAERRIYLPLAALVVLGVLAARAALTRVAPFNRTRLGIALTIIVCVTLTAITYARNGDYHDRLVLWQTVVDARPHGRAHHNLAIELAARQRADEAIDHYRLATPDAPEAHYALGYALAQAGRPAEAAAQFRRLLERLPKDALAPRASNMLGMILAQQGDHAGAIAAFRTTLAMLPKDADALGGVADGLRASGRLDEAEAAYRAYLESTPGNAAAYGNLGIVLSARGKDAEATAVFAQAVTLAPGSAGARLNYGLSLIALGRTAEAVAELRRAVELAPGDTRGREALAALGVGGR